MEQTKIKKYIKWSRILVIAGIATSFYILMMDLSSPDFLSMGQRNTGEVVSMAMVALGLVLVLVSQEKFSLKKFLIGAFIFLVGFLSIIVLLPR